MRALVKIAPPFRLAWHLENSTVPSASTAIILRNCKLVLAQVRKMRDMYCIVAMSNF
jgi:hypothetical protein